MTPLLFIRTHVFGMTQAEIAAVAGVGQSTVSKWEKGQLEPSRREMALIRAEAVRRRKKWRDAWFFSAPVTEQDDAMSSNEGAAA